LHLREDIGPDLWTPVEGKANIEGVCVCLIRKY
jgi:hypothetical protein